MRKEILLLVAGDVILQKEVPENLILEASANAALISASPDMLSVLKFILEDGNSTICGDTAEIIQAVIEKATGGVKP